jgi:hypothetical protein
MSNEGFKAGRKGQRGRMSTEDACETEREGQRGRMSTGERCEAEMEGRRGSMSTEERCTDREGEAVRDAEHMNEVRGGEGGIEGE